MRARWTEEFFILLHVEDKNNCPNFPRWKNVTFDLELLDDEVCLKEFRFTKRDIDFLCHVIGFPIP